METPSSTMYADLKNFGRVSNRDAAWLLLSPEARHGGTLMRPRISTDRPFLSREVVHASPRGVPTDRFGDIAGASLTLFSRVLEARGGSAAVGELSAHYAGPAADNMRRSLADNGLDEHLYANALEKVSQAALDDDRSRGILYLMLFVATGCLGDPRRSIHVVEDFASRKLSTGLYTTETSVGPGFARSLESEPPEVALGLLRLVDGAARLPVRRLSTAPEGTTVGVLAGGPEDVTDVDRDVSRRHLRIWRSNGRWWAQGLGSTNGTTIVSGDTREVRVVEPPRGLRVPGMTYPPQEILDSDLLCLGATTQFLVLRIAP